MTFSSASAARPQPHLAADSVPVLALHGLRFRDLDRDGTLSPFEDWRLPSSVRAQDLVSRMSVEEKAGALLHDVAPVKSLTYDEADARKIITGNHVTSLITRLAATPGVIAEQANRLQSIATGERLGIPLTISTDPRSHFQVTDGASVASMGYSKWPEPLGFGAIGSQRVVNRFAAIARQEYRATGITIVLGPQADLATEPRWPRINGTFGEDVGRVGKLAGAYVRGFQHGSSGVASDGVATVVKHWAGYGASVNGYDGHSWYGRFAHLSQASLRIHESAFDDALKAQAYGIMPAYSILRIDGAVSSSYPEVGVAFNRHMIWHELREKRHFGGVVLSDWSITRDCPDFCRNGFPAGVVPTREGFSTAWGMENASVEERHVAALQAGVDQFGGASDPAPILSALRTGRVSAKMVDRSVIRIMELKFRQGLFEDPYVDVARATALVGQAKWRQAGEFAQAMAIVLLKHAPGLMPLPNGKRVYLHGMSPESAKAHGLEPVGTPQEADFAIVRLKAPWQGEHPNYFYGARQHEGRLDFHDGDAGYDEFRKIARQTPTVAIVYLDRPAILTLLRKEAAGLLVDFGASDNAVLNALSGKVVLAGRLPVELPSSAPAVARQRGDLAHDSIRPLYPIGFGLSLHGHSIGLKLKGRR